MSWFKKSKKPKSHQPSQQPASLGVPAHIAAGPLGFGATLDLGVYPEDVHNGGGSQITLLGGGSGDQQLHPPGPSTRTPEPRSGTITPQEPERGLGVPSDTPNERPSVAKKSEDEDDNDSISSYKTVPENFSSRSGSPPAQPAPPRSLGGDEHEKNPAVVLIPAIPADAHVDLGASEKDAGNTREEEGGSTVSSRIPEMHRRATVLGAATILAGVTEGSVGGFGYLKAILGAIAAVYEETVAAGNKIENLLSRITTLEALFTTRPSDVEEQRRRSELIHKLEDIGGQLQSLCKRQWSQQLADRIQEDENIFRLLEDLQEAVFNYQTVQQTMIYEQGCRQMDAAEAAILDNFRCARAAGYRHGDRRGCLKGTRGAVLDEIELWTRNFDKPPVYWLNGLAGTGKSTIAQTIAERVFADGQLGASFFCSRDFLDRSDLHFIFPTLAVQLARKYAKFRSILVPLMQSDRGIADESLYHQMEKLIVRPLVESAVSTVIVIDALDECKDREPASAILSVLGQFVSQIPKVKFFVTGRPEPRIREGFRLPLLAKATDVFVLHEVEPGQINSDVRLFFRHQFSELNHRRGGLDGWPIEKQLDLLCERAAGLFVYAVATVKFIDKQNSNPRKRLDLLLRSLGLNSVREGKTEFRSKTTLDSLYMSILLEAFDDNDSEDDPKIRSVLGAVTLAANPLSPSTIATLLGFDADDVFPFLSSVHSLLILQGDVDHPVRPFHKSFPDFIIDSTRCADQRFYISPPDHHSELVVGCLELMNRKLEKNMCKLPDSVTNSKVVDLREKTEQYVDYGLRYACESWHKHLVDLRTVPAHTPKIISALDRFLKEKFLFWLEVLSVLGTVRDAVDALEVAAKYLEASPTLNLINDYFRFITGFFEVISTSAPHIYHSALPLSPKTSIVQELYEKYTHPLTRIVQGAPKSWDPTIATMDSPHQIGYITWSPCSRLIAISLDFVGVQVLDAATLKQVNFFTPPKHAAQLVTFSPETRLLTWLGKKPDKFINWDLQTGVQVGEIPIEEGVSAWRARSITYSECGTMFGVLFEHGNIPSIGTYDVLSNAQIHYHPMKGSGMHVIWTYGKCLRFAALRPGSITIWEVEFTSRKPPTEVKTLPAPDNFDPHPSKKPLFLPTLSRLAFVVGNTVLVWDAQHSKLLLHSIDLKKPARMAFSPDGHFFACGTNSPEIYLWKGSSTGYILYQRFMSGDVGGWPTPFLSPDGQSILMSRGSILQLRRTSDSTTSSSVPTHGLAKDFILEFSPDGLLVAVARLEGNTVKILNLKSGTSQLAIDTDMQIIGLGVAESTVIVVGNEKIITWNLPTGDYVPNARVNINNSVSTVTFNNPPPRMYVASVSPNLNYIAILEEDWSEYIRLSIYSTSTGKHLTDTPLSRGSMLWFTPDGHEIWSCDGIYRGWTITGNSKSNITKLEPLESTAHLSRRSPWQPACGHQVTDSGWILNSSGKQLLWLPPQWRDEIYRVWSGQFLVLLHPDQLEVVILELPE